MTSYYLNQPDKSTADRHLKSPRPLSGISLHLTLLAKKSWSWSWMAAHIPFVQYQSVLHSWDMAISNLTLKIHGQGHACGQRSWPWKFKVKVTAKVKQNGHIWIPEFNRYVCFSFRGNRIIFGWDIANSIFNLENWRWGSWSRSNLMVTFEA